VKIGLFFGSFNPIHIGHMTIAQYMLDFADIDELWFIISPQNPHKTKVSLLFDADRYEMVYRAVQPYDKMRASNIEFMLPKPSYTIVTLTYLTEKYKEHDFSIIMGGDNLASLPNWRNYTYILEHFKILVYARPHSEIPKELESHSKISYYDAPQMEISSSFIRQCIQNKKQVRAYMPFEAWEYLDKMHFYR
jgi:nicotinate-nucleotide adenylyltransferase